MAGKSAATRKIHKKTGTPPVRFVTAASLFDGHDAAINIMRRILQGAGVEVIHLGHNRSVEEIVTAAIHEDAHGIAVSSYQGGHVEYFKYMIDLLKERGRPEIKVFGGGGGVITASEIETLTEYGVCRLYTPADGRKMGLDGMVEEMIGLAGPAGTSPGPEKRLPNTLKGLEKGKHPDLARFITALEAGVLAKKTLQAIRALAKGRMEAGKAAPVLGITGTGGAGKSSLTDELILRFRLYSNEPKIAVIAIDPSRRRTGGALLGDRIRMNAISSPKIFMRSLATRESKNEVPEALDDIVACCQAAGFDLIIVETPGIGQGDAAIVDSTDVSLYVMTPDFGAASQLEKIDMLDFADVVAINKMDRLGALDALRDVRKQVQRNRKDFTRSPDQMPVFPTIASRFSDPGVTTLYKGILERFIFKNFKSLSIKSKPVGLNAELAGSEPGPGIDAGVFETHDTAIVPPERSRYLAEIAATVRGYHRIISEQVSLARERQQLTAAKRILEADGKPAEDLTRLIEGRDEAMDPRAKKLLETWPERKKSLSGDDASTAGEGGRPSATANRKITQAAEKSLALKYETLSGLPVSRVALPAYEDDGEILKWLLKENLPGFFPYTAGVFPFKRAEEDPTRMFAGEGDPKATNERFKLLSRHSEAKRLSTAFDSVTLYGRDPDKRPDIYGKVGNSGVSVATWDDMKVLYGGFDLLSPSTSVSMTINGPAPAILAMFLNTAITQALDSFKKVKKRAPKPKEAAKIRKTVLENVRGTVQADILKEDQGQNTCIFSTEFALKMMADIQEYFIENRIKNFYSVSISGYHIAEAGANPISQLAFTLANGFTFVEAYLARGMKIDDFVPNLSFFFSNGMDPEYTVMGRVARRIWATAMRFKYNGNKRSQRLKYHIQTSGRSLHAQEMDFNDIRTTLQALIAVYDNCNSLHTNAHDEAFTTPTPESLRRAMAIQLIINKEWGLTKNENPNQGAFIIDELTDLVEEAVLQEFERISERGGVLGAMETGYQRGKIQEESMLYETRKHDGTLPIIGVNTFLDVDSADSPAATRLQRSSRAQKDNQIKRLEAFKKRNAKAAPKALAKIRETATSGGNVFAVLMEAVQCCTLGQITDALFEAGGQYRRNM
ncbi:MAG: methylmalonyl-CoA mutase family protein [Rhodospirillales bacterium]|nr:methylmalonyl-CoA mutase family protein [Alphaproteobacteria bacterium]MBL6947752.1 methylmalonyl-CoA mutase family protein [Rhodospirillales bacterium]